MKRGTGWLADAPDPRDWSAEALPGLTGGIIQPASVDLSQHVDQVRDQLSTESCVLQTLCRCMHMRASIQGRKILFPSVLAAYYDARLLQVGDPSRVANLGCYPRLALQALSRFGVCAEERWPLMPFAVDVAPPWDCKQHAIDSRVTGYYRIASEGQQRLDDMRRALAAGYPLHVGFAVDKALYDLGSEVLGEVGEKTGGRHAMAIIGYGDGYFLGVNSWGSSWGFGGFFRVSDARVADTGTSDIWAVTEGPREVT